jgi:hypothetical protein
MTTKTTQFTPGPWQVNDSTENDDDTTLTIFAPADEVEIATMSAYENGCECFSEIRENAHLIAAAPAMYEALRQAYAHLAEMGCDCEEGQSCGDCIVCQCETALAQAEGRDK